MVYFTSATGLIDEYESHLSKKTEEIADATAQDENLGNNNRSLDNHVPIPPTAGTHYTVSTAPEQHMDRPFDSESTVGTSISVVGSSRGFENEQNVQKKDNVNEDLTSQKARASVTAKSTKISSQEGTSKEMFDINLFCNSTTAQILDAEIQQAKNELESYFKSKDHQDSQILRVTSDVKSQSPLDQHTKLNFQEVLGKLEDYTLDYRLDITQLAEKLQEIDDQRNQWLESTYMLDMSRTASNFATLKIILDQHEEYIEAAKKDFLESLISIKVILGLDK